MHWTYVVRLKECYLSDNAPMAGCRKTDAGISCSYFLWSFIYTIQYCSQKATWLRRQLSLMAYAKCERTVGICDCFTSGPWATIKCSWKPHNSTWGIYTLLWMNICLTHRSDMQPACLCVCSLPHALSVCIRSAGAQPSCLPWYETMVMNIFIIYHEYIHYLIPCK